MQAGKRPGRSKGGRRVVWREQGEYGEGERDRGEGGMKRDDARQGESVSGGREG